MVLRQKGFLIFTSQKERLYYRSVGRRRPERPLKRLLDGYNREAETGHLLSELRDKNKKNFVNSPKVLILATHSSRTVRLH